MSALTVQPVEKLYHKYPRQTEQQPCYLELTEDGTVLMTWDGEIGGAVPATVWHGRDRRWNIPCLKSHVAEQLMNELLPLLERVHAGLTVEWDGNNMVGSLDEDAYEASEEIEKQIETLGDDNSNFYSVSEAGDWLADSNIEVSPDATDEDLEKMAQELTEEANENGLDEIEGLEEYLEEKRDEARLLRK